MKQVFFLKLRLYLCHDDKQAIIQTMVTYQKACNFVSFYIKKTGITERKDLNDQLYHLIRQKFHLCAQMTQSVFRTVFGKYKMMESQHKEERTPSFSKIQCDQVYGRDYYFLQNGRVSLGIINGRLKPKFSKKGFERFFKPGWRFGTASLFVDDNGIVFLTVTAQKVEVSVSKPKKESSLYVGVDRGIINPMVAYSSNGEALYFKGEEIQKKRETFLKVRSELKKRKTPSSRRHLKRMGRRENRYISNTNHCLAKALLNSFPDETIFVFEKLQRVQKTAKGHDQKPFRKMVNTWAYYDLLQKIEFKAKEKNDQIFYVPSENTSRGCPKCGYVDPANRSRLKHQFHCKHCGFTANDDVAAAMNICKLGMND